MAFGLGVLRLPPRDFWSMTPAELAAAVEGLGGGSPRAAATLNRETLTALMTRFPDIR